MYDCNNLYDEILQTIFAREELNNYEFILEGELEISDDESECDEYRFSL